MAERSVTREMPQLEIRAEVQPSSLDKEKRTVDLTWTTGARVKRGFWEPYHEELSLHPKHVRMDRLSSGSAPLLNSHRSYDLGDVIGVVESAKLDGKRGTATVRFARSAEGEDAFQKVSDGIVKNVSVGYRVHKLVKIEDGEDKVPVYRAEDWEPHEISMVPIGADAGAVTRSAGGTNACIFIEERAMPPEQTENKTETTTTTSAAVITAPTVTDAQRAEIELAERTRSEGIRRVGGALERPETEVAEAIRSGMKLEVFRAAAQDKFAEAKTIGIDKRDPRIEAGADRKDKWLRGAEAWLLERTGVLGLVSQASKLPEWQQAMRVRGLSVDVAVDPGEFRGARMLDLARQALELGGERASGVLPMDLVGRAFTRAGTLGGLAATGDFPILLENVLYKTLLAQYMITPDTWRKFCRVGSVQDFRASKRYRLGTFGSLSSLNEAGEFVNKSIPDGERQSITASTKGNIIGISRQVIINDDMGAFVSLATMLGRAAALSIEVDVYGMLTANAGMGQTMQDANGNTLFHASRNNVGAGAALGSGSIDANRVIMAQQKDPSGNEILALTPAILLVPIGLGGVARQINNGQYDFDSTKFQTPNRVGGLFRDIIDTPRLTGTRRYLLADPAVAPTFEVAFLDGQQQPFMDVMQGWRQDGVEWKVRLDYGFAPIDFRGAVTDAGV